MHALSSYDLLKIQKNWWNWWLKKKTEKRPRRRLWSKSWTLFFYRSKLLFSDFSNCLTDCHTPKQQHCSSKVKGPIFLSKWATFHVCSKRINRVFKPPQATLVKKLTPQFYPRKLLFGSFSYWLTDSHTPGQQHCSSKVRRLKTVSKWATFHVKEWKMVLSP